MGQVSRLLALVESLPESMQQQVRAGELSAHIAMKYLAPVARASLNAGQQMAGAFTRHKFPTRQSGESYAARRDGLRDKDLAIAVDNFGNAFVTGWTLSSNFPSRPVPFSASRAVRVE